MRIVALLLGSIIIIIVIIIIMVIIKMQTDRSIPNNKPDIIIRDNEREHVC